MPYTNLPIIVAACKDGTLAIVMIIQGYQVFLKVRTSAVPEQRAACKKGQEKSLKKSIGFVPLLPKIKNRYGEPYMTSVS